MFKWVEEVDVIYWGFAEHFRVHVCQYSKRGEDVVSNDGPPSVLMSWVRGSNVALEQSRNQHGARWGCQELEPGSVPHLWLP